MENEHQVLARETIGDFNPNDRDDVAAIKNAAKNMIETISEHTPAGRRRSIAITHIEEAVMMAVKSLFEG